MEGLTAGRVVHFAHVNNKHYASVVSEVTDKEQGLAVLHVFLTPRSPLFKEHGPVMCIVNVEYNEHATELGTWHWPERV